MAFRHVHCDLCTNHQHRKKHHSERFKRSATIIHSSTPPPPPPPAHTQRRKGRMRTDLLAQPDSEGHNITVKLKSIRSQSESHIHSVFLLQCCFTSIETVRTISKDFRRGKSLLLGTESPVGRPPRLSHSSGALIRCSCHTLFIPRK